MMKGEEKRQTRIDMLHKRALAGKYTWSNQFHFDALVNDAKTMSVSKATAESYADAVIIRLRKRGHIKI